MAQRSRTTVFIIIVIVVLQLLATSGPGSAQPLTSQGIPSQSTPQTDSPSPKFGVVPADRNAGNHIDDLSVRPGDSVDANAVVLNVGEISVDLIVYVANITTGSNGGPVFGALDEPLTEPASWASLEPIELTLGPGESANVVITIHVPRDIAPGQYVAGIVAEAKDTFAISGTDTYSQRLRYAIRLGIVVPGDGLTGSVSLGEPTTNPGQIHIPIQNLGNYWIKPKATFELLTLDGAILAEVQFPLDIIFAGDETEISLGLPDQFPAGDYLLSVTVSDEVSGQSDSFEKVAITIPEPEDPRGLFVDEHIIEPNGDELVFANVEVLVRNGGDQIQAANVLLEVSHDGVVVEEFPLATNQVLISGENLLSARYLPEDTWESGTYTFRVIVKSVDPNGGTEITLLEEELDAEIIVP